MSDPKFTFARDGTLTAVRIAGEMIALEHPVSVKAGEQIAIEANENTGVRVTVATSPVGPPDTSDLRH